jgi:hypothetical protein
MIRNAQASDTTSSVRATEQFLSVRAALPAFWALKRAGRAVGLCRWILAFAERDIGNCGGSKDLRAENALGKLSLHHQPD